MSTEPEPDRPPTESEAPGPTAAPAKGTPREAPVPEVAAPVEDWATRFKYLLADFENYRKRADREREAARLSARADILRALLPIFEASEKARDAVAQLPAKDPVRRGLDLLGVAWHSFLEGEKVTPVAHPGARFASELHEAVAEAPARSAHDDGTVVEVVQQGYRLGTALLRPAKVVVARLPSRETEPAAAAADLPSDEGAG